MKFQIFVNLIIIKIVFIFCFLLNSCATVPYKIQVLKTTDRTVTRDPRNIIVLPFFTSEEKYGFKTIDEFNVFKTSITGCFNIEYSTSEKRIFINTPDTVSYEISYISNEYSRKLKKILSSLYYNIHEYSVKIEKTGKCIFSVDISSIDKNEVSGILLGDVLLGQKHKKENTVYIVQAYMIDTKTMKKGKTYIFEYPQKVGVDISLDKLRETFTNTFINPEGKPEMIAEGSGKQYAGMVIEETLQRILITLIMILIIGGLVFY